LLAQKIDSKQKSKLEQIRREIEDYRQRLSQERQKESQLLDALAGVEKEIDLMRKLIGELKKEDRKKSQLISQISSDLDNKTSELKRLQDIYAKRIVSFYKYGRTKDIEFLLSSQSFNRKLTWLKFQKLIADNDRRNYLNILGKKQKIESQRDKLKQEIIGRRNIIKEKSEEEKKLQSGSAERNKLLADVQNNKEMYLKKIREFELSAKEIQRLISSAENRKAAADNITIPQSSDFPSLRGRMIWPTDGKIVSRFGKYRHPKWKTVIENIGIDIDAEYGQEVRSISHGIVTAITWVRGMGNVIIINHFGGYFSVYSHLSQIIVTIDEEVTMGQVIGNVGDSGSLQGAMLHFQIWKNNEALNPEEWLS
jgi:septal ring factor EnvC (AmiA/AmiB activator)